MNRKDFIKSLTLTGVAINLPFSKLKSQEIADNHCRLVPTETAGPFPLDLSDNSFYFRKDITEDRGGIPIHLKIKVLGVEDCLPIENARVNIWHCDKDGNYSGYNSEQGKTYLRGYQITNSDGEIDFLTIFPGWYDGRICHIHFQVYISSAFSAVSQFGFDLEMRDKIYKENPEIYTKGEDPLQFEEDFAFVDGYELQVASVNYNEELHRYESYYEVAIKSKSSSGKGYYENQNAKQFEMFQNFPNPFEKETKLPLKLHKTGRVKLDLWSIEGKKIVVLENNIYQDGYYEIPISLEKLNLPQSSYVCQLTFINEEGKFTCYKMMSNVLK